MRNRYLTYGHERSIEEKVELAGKIPGVDGVNVRSRRDGKWQRGSVSSQIERERIEAVDGFRSAMDFAAELGTNRITTCPLNEGHDYVFEMNCIDGYQYMEDSFAKICEHNRGIKICVEYKPSGPRTRTLVASAGEAIAQRDQVGAPNLGTTLDFGHSLLAGERPAQAAVLLKRAGRLFYVHLNDNDRCWDWDQAPGAYHINELIEFFYYLKKIDYVDDWFAFDVLVKEIATDIQFAQVTNVTRRLESLAKRIDPALMDPLLAVRDPSQSNAYFHEALFGPGET